MPLFPSLLFWLLLALAVFWAVGAYNRLVLLRSQALAAFTALEPAFAKQVELVLSSLPDMGAKGQTRPADLGDEVDTLWLALRAATSQFSASLAASRPRPMDARNAAALAAAWAVLAMAWDRLQNEAYDLAGPALPETLASQWRHLTSQLMPLREHFNQSVHRYNQAIGQFPALLLAWLFQLKPGHQL
jgi:LemA protein